MPLSPTLVRVREKNQITLPRDIMNALEIDTPGYIAYTVTPGEVILRAVKKPDTDKLGKIRSFGQSVKSVYKNTHDADNFINNLREEWGR